MACHEVYAPPALVSGERGSRMCGCDDVRAQLACEGDLTFGIGF